MEEEDDDDCEAVLKDSELYKYLLQCNTSEFDVYDKADNVKEENDASLNAKIKAPIVKVPTELLKYLDIILNSNILLDDDVSYLYGFTIDLISDHNTRKYGELILSTAIGSLSILTALKCSGTISLNCLIEPSLFVNNYYIRWQRKNYLTKLIVVVKQLHLYFKKTLRVLYEENAYFKLNQLKSNSNDEKDEFFQLEKKKRREVESLSIILCECMKDNIILTRNTTLYLIRNIPLAHPIDSKEHYLACMTDEQLGLPSCSKENINSSSTSSLETLKNIYLLMQSEFFRRLGLCFCPTLWHCQNYNNLVTNIFQIIQVYTKSCYDISLIIQFYYKKHVFPEKMISEKSINPVLAEGYSSIHKINKSLSDLIYDSRILEEYVENLNSLNENEVNRICFKLNDIKLNLNKSIENIISAEKYFVKLKRIKEVKNDEIDFKQISNDESKVKNIEIGKTHNDIDSKDHVYFAITQGNEESHSNEDNNDFEPIKLPNFILNELKEALIEKQNEFTDREIKAVDNPDEYKKFLDAPDVRISKRERIQHDLPENVNPNGLLMHKMLANAIAQNSSKFMKQDEEKFGSSDESDSS